MTKTLHAMAYRGGFAKSEHGRYAGKTEPPPMTLKRIREADDALNQIVGDTYLQIPHALQSTPFHTTASVLSSLVHGLVSLKTGILDLAEAGNVYAAFVLFRVFLEHIVKTNAIFLKTLDEQSDDFAQQYLRLRIKEAFDYLRACEQVGLEIGGNPKSVLDQWITGAQELSAAEVKKLDDPFRYRTLICTIRKLLGSNSADFLSKVIPNYSELSGFVHGGPTAREKLDLIHAEGRGATELYRIADLSVNMLYSAQRWLFMLASTFRLEFQRTYDRLDEAIDGLNKQPEGRTADPG